MERTCDNCFSSLNGPLESYLHEPTQLIDNLCYSCYLSNSREYVAVDRLPHWPYYKTKKEQ